MKTFKEQSKYYEDVAATGTMIFNRGYWPSHINVDDRVLIQEYDLDTWRFTGQECLVVITCIDEENLTVYSTVVDKWFDPDQAGKRR